MAATPLHHHSLRHALESVQDSATPIVRRLRNRLFRTAFCFSVTEGRRICEQPHTWQADYNIICRCIRRWTTDADALEAWQDHLDEHAPSLARLYVAYIRRLQRYIAYSNKPASPAARQDLGRAHKTARNRVRDELAKLSRRGLLRDIPIIPDSSDRKPLGDFIVDDHGVDSQDAPAHLTSSDEAESTSDESSDAEISWGSRDSSGGSDGSSPSRVGEGDLGSPGEGCMHTDHYDDDNIYDVSDRELDRKAKLAGDHSAENRVPRPLPTPSSTSPPSTSYPASSSVASESLLRQPFPAATRSNMGSPAVEVDPGASTCVSPVAAATRPRTRGKPTSYLRPATCPCHQISTASALGWDGTICRICLSQTNVVEAVVRHLFIPGRLAGYDVVCPACASMLDSAGDDAEARDSQVHVLFHRAQISAAVSVFCRHRTTSFLALGTSSTGEGPVCHACLLNRTLHAPGRGAPPTVQCSKCSASIATPFWARSPHGPLCAPCNLLAGWVWPVVPWGAVSDAARLRGSAMPSCVSCGARDAATPGLWARDGDGAGQPQCVSCRSALHHHTSLSGGVGMIRGGCADCLVEWAPQWHLREGGGRVCHWCFHPSFNAGRPGCSGRYPWSRREISPRRACERQTALGGQKGGARGFPSRVCKRGKLQRARALVMAPGSVRLFYLYTV